MQPLDSVPLRSSVFLQLAGVPFSKVLQQSQPSKRQKSTSGILGPATPAEQAQVASASNQLPHPTVVNGGSGLGADSSQDWQNFDAGMHSRLVIDRLSGLARLGTDGNLH